MHGYLTRRVLEAIQNCDSFTAEDISDMTGIKLNEVDVWLKCNHVSRRYEPLVKAHSAVQHKGARILVYKKTDVAKTEIPELLKLPDDDPRLDSNYGFVFSSLKLEKWMLKEISKMPEDERQERFTIIQTSAIHMREIMDRTGFVYPKYIVEELESLEKEIAMFQS